MKIQGVNVSSSIPNYTNQNFKAKFINDKNGYFRKLWQEAILNKDLEMKIDQFSKNNIEHTLEITDAQYDSIFTIFNHRNGFSLPCKTTLSPKFKLFDILDQISKSNIFEKSNSKSAQMYQKLTGQNYGSVVEII